MNLSEINYVAMAATAAGDCLTAGGDLSASIAKIAEDRGLSQVEIQRVVEMANHRVNEQLRKQADDKTFSFQVATLDRVLTHLIESESSIPKLAEAVAMRTAVTDFARERSLELLAEFDKNASVNPVAVAYQNKVALAAAIKTAERLHLYQRKALADQTSLRIKIAEQLGDLTQHALNHVSRTGCELSDLKKFACSAFPSDGQLWDTVFDEIHSRLLKTASSPMVRKLKRDALSPSDEIPVEVINGRHRYQVELDTLKNKVSEEDRYARRRILLNTLGPAVVKSIRDFQSSADVSKYVNELTIKHAEAISDEASYLEGVDDMASRLHSVGGLDKLAARGDIDIRAAAIQALLANIGVRSKKITKPWHAAAAVGQGSSGGMY